MWMCLINETRLIQHIHLERASDHTESVDGNVNWRLGSRLIMVPFEYKNPLSSSPSLSFLQPLKKT